MAFITKGTLIRSREEYPDYSMITERIGGMDDKVVVWDSRSGLPDPDADKPFVEAWWTKFDTADGYSKDGDGTYGSSSTYEPFVGLKAVWDSRVDGIPQSWRDEEENRRAKYDQSVKYAGDYYGRSDLTLNIHAMRQEVIQPVLSQLSGMKGCCPVFPSVSTAELINRTLESLIEDFANYGGEIYSSSESDSKQELKPVETKLDFDNFKL